MNFNREQPGPSLRFSSTPFPLIDHSGTLSLSSSSTFLLLFQPSLMSLNSFSQSFIFLPRWHRNTFAATRNWTSSLSRLNQFCNRSFGIRMVALLTVGKRRWEVSSALFDVPTRRLYFWRTTWVKRGVMEVEARTHCVTGFSKRVSVIGHL